MKTKSINTLVTKLKRLNTAYDRLQKKRKAVPIYDRLKVWPALQTEADKLCGEMMRTERCIINALLGGAT